jgi:8-oxo-dGTP pyrophosphatase MutT (NUDIX family)
MRLLRLLRRPRPGKDDDIVVHDPETGQLVQAGALPWRRSAKGGVEYLLVTSRDSQRWIVPKGWPMRDRTLAESAAQEAYEEGGVQGRIASNEIGAFDHRRRDSAAADPPFRVFLFTLEVERELDDWPEMDRRTRAWFDGEGARAKLESGELAKLIRAFEARLAAGL